MGWLTTIGSVKNHLDAAGNRRFSGPLKAERVGEEKTSFRNKTQILMGDWCRKADTEKPKSFLLTGAF
jgi:hypothetical protein